MNRVLASAAAWAAFWSIGAAQPAPAESAAPPAAPAPAPAVTAGLRLTADTMVRIELAEVVSSKDRKTGDMFAIRLSSPIVVDGRIVAPAGAVGQGQVVYAERGGAGGSPGKLVLAARYIDAPGGRVRLKAFNLGAAGESELYQLEVAAQLIGPGVLFIKGHNVVYPIGTRAHAKVSEDVVLPPGPPAETAAARQVTSPASETTAPASAAPFSAPSGPSPVPAQETTK